MTVSSREQDPQHCMIRVSLLGTFEVAWEGQSFPPERLAGRGAAPALGLLKALLTQPDRFATRDWIMEQFWPESQHNRASERLDDVASHLRTLLRPPESTAKILHYVYAASGKGSGYRLEGYPLIWVDADAFEWYAEQAARFERFGHDALPLWERAYELGSRGEFLPEERYSDWTRERREFLAGLYRQCMHRLTTLLREQGATEQAILRLRSYWQTHQIDEDVLRPLMELLGVQERYQEAEQYYEQCVTALEEEGRVPDLRTQDIREFLRAKQLQRHRSTTHGEVSPVQHITSLFPFTGGLTDNLLSASISTKQQKQSIAGEYPLDREERFVPLSALREETRQFQNTGHIGRDIIQTRRQILHHLLMIGSMDLLLSSYAVLYPDGSELLNVSVLEELETITASYWRLCANTSLDLLGNLSEHFRTVVNLLQHVFPHKTGQRLCSLAGEIAQILGKTLFDLQEYSLAWSYYMFSLKAAQSTSNYDLWAAGIGRMILLLLYWKHPQHALPLLDEVRQLPIQNTRVVCWLAAVEAEVHAHRGDAEACETALKTAKQIAKNEPLGEDRYATGFCASHLAGYEGACFIRLHRPSQALPALQQALSLLDPQAIRQRSTVLTDMGIAYAQQGNIQKACQLARQALTITEQTKSQSVLERVRMVHVELEEWREITEVKELAKQLDTTLTLITI